MLLNEYILGSGPKKITPFKSKGLKGVKSVPKLATKLKASKAPKPPKAPKVPKAPKAPKPIKVIPVSAFGYNFISIPLKKTPIKRAPKNPLLSDTYRGAEELKLKSLAVARGQLSPKVLKDRDQCNIALGDVDCNGNHFCYICLSKLIPHTNVYNVCKSTTTAWDISTLPFVDEDAKYYPQCEHVLACKSVSDDLNPWYMNFMMYKIHDKLLKAALITAEPNIPSIISSVALPTITTDITYLNYFLRIIIRMNYEWSHAICNNIKSNLEFAEFDGVNYSINTPMIIGVLNMLFDYGKNYYESIEVELGNNLLNKSLPISINRTNLSAGPMADRTMIKFAAQNSINIRVQFILDQLTFSRTLNPSGKGFSKFKHSTIAFPYITHGGSNGKIFIEKIENKINKINEINEIQKIKKFETNINIEEIDIDFNSITIPDNDIEFINFIKNIHKIIFIEMLNKEANNNIKEIKNLIRQISNFDIDDYFFQEVILDFNNNKDDIETNIKNLYDYIMLYNKNKLVKNANIYNEIKKIENTKSYDLLIQLINHILYNTKKDYFIKRYSKICDEKINSFNQDQLKSNYLKFLTLNNPTIQEKYNTMLLEIYNRTSEKTIKQHLFIIYLFQKILREIINEENIETEFYNICYIYFKLCINYGHLDKTKLNDKQISLKEIARFLKKISSRTEITQKEYNLLKHIRHSLSHISEEQ